MTRAQSNMLLLLSAAIWGCGNVAQKMVLADLGPFTVVGIRGLLAVLTVLPFAAGEFETAPRLGRADWLMAGIVSALFAAATALTQVAFGGTTATNAGFLINTSTVMTPFIAWRLSGLSQGWSIWPAGIATCAGIWLLGGASLASISSGDAICVLAAAMYSLWMVLLGRFVMRTRQPMLAAVLQFGATAVLGLGLGLPLEDISLDRLSDALPLLYFLGVVSTGAGFAISSYAQGYTPASDASIILSAESLFGAASAALLLGERLSLPAALGAALIMAGIALVQVASIGAAMRFVHGWVTLALLEAHIQAVEVLPARYRRFNPVHREKLALHWAPPAP